MSDAEDFLLRHGYRRCDIAACNCNSWHGGHANVRLREIGEVLEQAGVRRNGEILLADVVHVVAENERLRDDAREMLQQLHHIRTHLYAATAQRIPSDDRIIADHVEQAYLRARDVIRVIEERA